MVNMHLTPEQLDFQDMLKNFVSKEIKPNSIKSDRLQPFDKPLMENLVAQLSELGLRSLNLSEDAGGVGADLLTSCIILEELAIGDVDIAITLGQTALVSGLLFDKWMTKEQRDGYIPNFLDNHSFHLAYAGNDPDASLGWNYHDEIQGESTHNPIVIKTRY